VIEIYKCSKLVADQFALGDARSRGEAAGQLVFQISGPIMDVRMSDD
jgi:hypothetical protein